MTTNARVPFKELFGKYIGIGPYGHLRIRKGSSFLQLTSPAMDATITVGAEVSDVRAITVQVTDGHGDNIDFAEELELALFLTAAKVSYVVTGGSTGIAIGANGAIQAIVAKKRWKGLTDITGKLTLTWTDSGTEAAFLGVRLPTGRYVIGAALANT